MRLLIYTPTFDRNDPVFGFAANWAEEFQKQCGAKVVFSRYVNPSDLPPDMQGIALGKSWIPRILKIWINSIKYRKQYDGVFVHMSPEVVLAGWPIWFLLGKPIYLWYAHGTIPWSLRVAEPLVKLIFASSETGMRLPTKKARFIGQGIDTRLFNPDASVTKENLLITVSRITPKKKYEETLEFLAEFNRLQPEIKWTYEIIGPLLGYEDYKKFLINKAEELGLGHKFKIQPQMKYEDLPRVYRKANVFLSSSQTGSIDKVALEALACGTPVIATGRGYQDIIGVTDMLNKEVAFLRLKQALIDPRIDWDAAKNISEKHSLPRLVSTLLDFLV